uniref:Transcriptional regulator, AraC family n=1 Tax=Cyanothece sp. (strain PCC 7425 / ATCC 29141) TaxID=395961 RepID=B8HV52_CYAP4
MTQFVPLFRVSSILPFVSFLDKIGAPTQQFLHQAKIPVATLDNSENLISWYSGVKFIDDIARREGIKSLGLEVGLQTPLEQLGSYGRLLRHSLTLFELFSLVEKLHHLFSSAAQVSLKYYGDYAWICHSFLAPRTMLCCQESHYTVMLYLNVIKLIAGNEWQPSQIQMTSKKYDFLTNIDQFSDTKFRFEQATNAICFPRAFLSRSLRHFNSYSDSQRQQDRKLLQATAPALDFPRSIQQVLRYLLRGGYPNIELAAEIAGMSVRSFQRCLGREGLTYTRMVEQVRFDAAIDYLQDPNIKIIEIALELGYQDPANFSRAFKRWTGISPNEYREQHCNN